MAGFLEGLQKHLNPLGSKQSPRIAKQLIEPLIDHRGLKSGITIHITDLTWFKTYRGYEKH